MPNLQSLIPNLQFEMPKCAFYPQLGILSVSSLVSQSVLIKYHKSRTLKIIQKIQEKGGKKLRT